MDYIRDISDFKHALSLSENILNKEYLKELKTLPLLPPSDTSAVYHISLFKLKNLSSQHASLMLEHIAPVLGVLHHIGASVGYLLQISSKRITVYFAVKTQATDALTAQNLIQNTLCQNELALFVELSDTLNSKNFLSEKLFNSNKISALSSLVFNETPNTMLLSSAASAIKSLISAMAGEEYRILFLADPVNPAQIKHTIYQLEDLFTLLDAIKQTAFTYNKNKSSNCTKTINESDAMMQTNALADSKTTTFSKEYDCKNFNTFITNYDVNEKLDYAVNVQRIQNNERHDTSSFSHTETNTEQNTESCSKSNSDANTSGSSTTYSFSGENKTAKELLKQTDRLLNMLYASKNLPQFNLGIYFFAPHRHTVLRAVFTFLDLASMNEDIQEKTILSWQKNDASFQMLLNYLSQLNHPRFTKSRNSSFLTPTSFITLKNLAHLICMPTFTDVL